MTFVQQEYEAMGEDLAQIQMNYLIRTGVQMLGLALISMMAAVLVTFLASEDPAFITGANIVIDGGLSTRLMH